MYVEAAAPARKAVTIPMLRAMKARGEKIAMLTCYDASFATLIETAAVDVALVGDSLGMVVQGRNSTLPVTLDDMAYHTRLVARGLSATLLVTDLPYMSYRDTAHAREAAARLLGECGAAMLKLEGAGWVCEIIADLVAREAPVCAHLGLTPQAVHRLGGYKVQGRESDAAERLSTMRRRCRRRRRTAGTRGRARGTGRAHQPGAADSRDRHRRRCRVRWPGAGAVRHARHHARQAAQIQQGFPDRCR